MPTLETASAAPADAAAAPPLQGVTAEQQIDSFSLVFVLADALRGLLALSRATAGPWAYRPTPDQLDAADDEAGAALLLFTAWCELGPDAP